MTSLALDFTRKSGCEGILTVSDLDADETFQLTSQVYSEHWDHMNRLTQIITNTTQLNCEGIFLTRGTTVEFERGDHEMITLPLFAWDTVDVSDLNAVIEFFAKAKATVNQAFNEKYPAKTVTATFTI